MSSGNKAQYADCLDQHMDLIQLQREIIELGEIMSRDKAPVVMGAEDFQEKAMESLMTVGRGLFSVSKWVGGKAIDGFFKGVTAAGNQIVKSFSTNEGLIKNILKDAGKVAGKEINVTAAKVALITSTGNPDHILEDMEILIKTLEVFDSHQKDVMAYLDKELITLKKLKSAKKGEQIHAVVDEFNELNYPDFKLGNKMGDAFKSDVLPGGRYFIYNSKDDKPVYSIAGEIPKGEGKALTMSKDEVSAILNKLDKVNAMHNRVKESYDDYLGFIRSWAEMVKGVDGNLAQLDTVSKTVIAEAEKLMAGNMGALAFYSGFTPRVVSYTDKYIHGVLGVFA